MSILLRFLRSRRGRRRRRSSRGGTGIVVADSTIFVLLLEQGDRMLQEIGFPILLE